MTTPLHQALSVPLQPGEVLPEVEMLGQFGRPKMPKTRRTGWERRGEREKAKEKAAERRRRAACR